MGAKLTETLSLSSASETVYDSLVSMPRTAYPQCMGKSWDEPDFIALARQHFENGFPTGSMLPNIQAFAQEAFDHYEDATAEGKAYLDAWLQKFYEFLAIKLEGAPDGAGTRKMKRLVALGRKKHFEAKKFIEYFPTILDKEPPLVEEALVILGKTLQCLFDILHDATQDSQDGPAKIAVLGLAYWLFDELTVAQYLARRNYSTLAYTHLRSVMEILDKIELFTQKPETAELWASGDEREVWKKLAPPRVRELLGRSSLDPVYKYFSEEGSHSTFTAMRPRLRPQANAPGEDRRIAIMIGGMKDAARQMSILIYCIQLAGQAIIMTESAFKERLDDVDIATMITTLTAETNVFYGHFFNSFDRSVANMEPLAVQMEVLQRMRDRGEI